MIFMLNKGSSNKIKDTITIHSNSVPLSIAKNVAKNFFVQCQNIDYHVPIYDTYPEWLNKFIKLIHQSYIKTFFVSKTNMLRDYGPNINCILTATVDPSRTAEYVSPRLIELGYKWNYDTKVMMACYAIPLSKFIPKDIDVFNETTISKQDLVNIFYIDLNSGAGLHVCSSSNQQQKLNLFTNETYNILRRPCKVDLCGKTLSIALNYNPPMTEYIIETWDTSNVAISQRIMDIKLVKGFEVEFLKSLEKYFNFKIMLVNRTKDQTNFSQQLEKGTIELLANFIAIDNYENNDYAESTYPLLHQEKYCLVLHRSFLPQKIVNLFEIFEYPVYLSVVAVVIIVSVIWLLILKLLTKLSFSNLPIGLIVMDVISITSRGIISRYNETLK